MSVVGVDVGGTKIAAGRLQDGELGEPEIVPTDRSGRAEALLDQFAAVIAAVRTADTAGVGIEVPSVVEWRTGRVKSSAHIPLRDVPLRATLRERLGLPVYVDNDANVAALAEAHDGDSLVHADLVMITVGIGVGGGIVIGGRIFRGVTGAAPELGHTLIAVDLRGGAAPAAPDPAAPDFPQPGSLEALAAGRALDGLALESARAHADSSLGRARAAGETPLGSAAVDAARAGDPEARRLVRILGERLGVGIANVINMFDPEVVVVGGGLARAGELLLGPAREVAGRFVLPGVGEETEIRPARHGAEAGVRGAALLAVHELREEEGR
jgi:glucokinase